MIDDFNYDELDPGIRETVKWLRSLGHDTTDSGDGRSKPADWYESGEALPYPHVYIQTGLGHKCLIDTAHTLLVQLELADIDVQPQNPEGKPYIQATYDPVNQLGIIELCNVDDALLLKNMPMP